MFPKLRTKKTFRLFSILAIGPVVTPALPAAATPMNLLDADGRFVGSSGGRVQLDAGVATLHAGGDQQYPAAAYTPAAGSWDLGGYTGVAFTVTNTGETRARVHGRVDNPGHWRDQPWSVDAKTLDPGQTQTVSVTFGESYGNPSHPLDPTRVNQVLVFVEKPKGPVAIRVDKIEAIASASDDAADSSTPAASGGETAVAPPISGELFTFDSAEDTRYARRHGAEFRRVAHGEGHAVEATGLPGERYPGVAFRAPHGAWNLAHFAGVKATVTNTSDRELVAALRVDNAGPWKDQPWNVERVSIAPGATETVRVSFGKSWGAPGYDLNPARVTQTVVYLERPGNRPATFVIDDIEAWGSADDTASDRVGLDGEVLGFGDRFDPSTQADGRGATVEHRDGRLLATFSAEEKWPAVYLTPRGRSWDLSNFESVSIDLTNRGEAAVTVFARVDDSPEADGHRHSNTENARLAPGQTRTVTVTFGKSWKKKGYDLDASHVVGVLIGVDRPARAARLAIDDLRATPKRWAELPDWLGRRPAPEGDWVQTLDENFDAGSLDSSLWTPRLVWDGPARGELQRYREGNVTVEDGKLRILCEKNPGHQYDDPSLDTRDYATGAVTSLDKWTQRYGYFEARIKAPTARGLWPAFWLMPDRGAASGLDIWGRRATENGGMEIDIWEHLTEWGPGRYNAAAHWDGYGKDHKQWGTSHLYHLPTPDGWHVYGVLWEPGRLTWYCDGKEMLVWENPRITDVPLYIKFTVQMGNWATNDVDDAALPDDLEVDWVRAWQLRERVE